MIFFVICHIHDQVTGFEWNCNLVDIFLIPILHLNQTLGELEKARTNATNGVKNLLDQSARKEQEAANTLATFKQAAWSLLERVLTSYDNTLSFIDNVGIAIRDCESIVRALWDQHDNNIYNRSCSKCIKG